MYPAAPLPPGADAYALVVLDPDGHARPQLPLPRQLSARNAFDHPLSSRFDEQDAFVIFDDVEVPRDRVFIDANPQVYNTAVATSWPPNFMQQTSIRAQTKLEFAWGIATRMLEATNGLTPGDRGDARGDLELRGADPRARSSRPRRAPTSGQRCVVSRRRALPRPARAAAAVVPARERDHPPARPHNLLAAPTFAQLTTRSCGP